MPQCAQQTGTLWDLHTGSEKAFTRTALLGTCNDVYWEFILPIFQLTKLRPRIQYRDKNTAMGMKKKLVITIGFICGLTSLYVLFSPLEHSLFMWSRK